MARLSAHHWFLILLTFAFLAVSLYYPIHYFDQLPDEYPVHFNASGQPDKWAEKNMGPLLIGPLITLGSMIILVPLTFWIAAIGDPRKVIKVEQIRQAVILLLLRTAALASLLVMVLSMEQVSVALGAGSGLGFLARLLPLVLLALTIWFSGQILWMVFTHE